MEIEAYLESLKCVHEEVPMEKQLIDIRLTKEQATYLKKQGIAIFKRNIRVGYGIHSYLYTYVKITDLPKIGLQFNSTL